MERPIRKTTLAEQAYEYIKEMIITGKLAPGEELPEEKLAAELGISRTPLREALKRLAVDALIDIRKTRSAIVSGFTHEDVQQIMELRKLLETYNIQQLSAADQRRLAFELKRNLEKQLLAITEEDFGCFMDMDAQFHLLLTEKSANKRLGELIQTLNTGGSRAFLLLSDTIQSSAKEAYEEHVAIVEAFRNEDTDMAGQQMEIHLANIEKRMLKTIKREEL